MLPAQCAISGNSQAHVVNSITTFSRNNSWKGTSTGMSQCPFWSIAKGSIVVVEGQLAIS